MDMAGQGGGETHEQRVNRVAHEYAEAYRRFQRVAYDEDRPGGYTVEDRVEARAALLRLTDEARELGLKV